jgi:hypothetical protein
VIAKIFHGLAGLFVMLLSAIGFADIVTLIIPWRKISTHQRIVLAVIFVLIWAAFLLTDRR